MALNENNKKPDIVFVNPPVSTSDRYGKMSKLGSVTPPLGISYLAGYLEKEGYLVSIVDGEVLNLTIDETVSQILLKEKAMMGRKSRKSYMSLIRRV